MGEPDITPAAVTVAAAGLGRSLEPDQAVGLARYLAELTAWNQRMNLVGHADWREVLADLAADSWRLADFLAELAWPAGEGRPRCVDVGAGAGLPGIPLRMFWTVGEYVLLEPRQKRVAFLNRALSLLRLPRTRAVCGRLEQAGSLFPADLFLSRAFRPWPEVLGLARPRLVPGGRCLVLASEPPPGPDDSRLAGWVLEAGRSYSSPSGERWFWSLTPASMPR
ncbi:MAG: RsmG family class I SAM-dependent methyltransferase [Thermodesulfobacteriota bacterium]